MIIGNIVTIELGNTGSPIYGVKNNIDDRYYSPCLPLSPFGGSDGTFANQGFEIGSQVLLTRHPDLRNLFVILGGFPSPDDYSSLRVHGIQTALTAEKRIKRTSAVEDSNPSTDSAEDHTEIHVSDQHIENSGSFINISPENGLTIQGARDVTRIQFKDSLRISRASDSSEAIINSSLIKDLQELFEIISASLEDFSRVFATLGLSRPTVVADLVKMNEKTPSLENHINKHIKIPKNNAGEDS